MNKQQQQPLIIKAKDTFTPNNIAVKNVDGVMIESKTTTPIKVLASSSEIPVNVESSKDEPKKQTTGEMWAAILHEVAEEEREAEKNKYLKVRKMEKTEPKTHITTNFSISGLKPENK